MAGKVGKPRRFPEPRDLEKAWEDYKEHCNKFEIKVVEFNKYKGKYVERFINKPISPTIKGFAVYSKFTRQSLYDTYKDKEGYCDIFACMQEEVEVISRTLFETGQLPTQIAPLWMSKHGYSNKQVTENINHNKNEDASDKLLKALKDRERKGN